MEMIVQVLQENLSKSLLIASRFTSPKAQLPILGNLLLSAKKNKLLISATNLESSVSLTIGAKVEKEGELTIPAKTISDLVNNLKDGQINLKVDKEKLIITCQDFVSEISGINAGDFPSIPQPTDTNFISLNKEFFFSSLNKTLFSVSIDETRPVLTGVLLILRNEELILVSTDGFRLSQKKIKIKNLNIQEELKVIIPKNALVELLKLGEQVEDVKMFFNKKENQVVFDIFNGILASRVIEGEFPDFERIIPKNAKVKVEVDREEFLRAIKLASVFAKDSANVVKLNIFENSLKISAESSQSGKQEMGLDIKTEFEDDTPKDKGFLIAYNYRFLEDFLLTAEEDVVKLEFSDPNSPGLFLDSKDPDYLHIIMPVRLQE